MDNLSDLELRPLEPGEGVNQLGVTLPIGGAGQIKVLMRLGLAIFSANAIYQSAGDGNDNFPGPWNYTVEDPTKPFFNSPKGFRPGGDNPGKMLKRGLAGWGFYRGIRHIQNWSKPKYPYNIHPDSTFIVPTVPQNYNPDLLP